MRAKVYLEWTPSVSNDVVDVHIKVSNGDTIVYDQHVTPDITNVEVGIFNEKDTLKAEVVVSDGTNTSDAVFAGFTVPDLTKPEPVENLGFTYEVVE